MPAGFKGYDLFHSISLPRMPSLRASYAMGSAFKCWTAGRWIRRNWAWSLPRHSTTFSPKNFKLDSTLHLMGSREVIDAIKKGEDPRHIALRWETEYDPFLKMRAKYLLY